LGPRRFVKKLLSELGSIDFIGLKIQLAFTEWRCEHSDGL